MLTPVSVGHDPDLGDSDTDDRYFAQLTASFGDDAFAEAFLLELSNASDALDKFRYESITGPEKIKAAPIFYTKIIPDKINPAISVEASGIGTSKNELIYNPGSIDLERIEAQPKFYTKIMPDKTNSSISVEDSGIGTSKNELINNSGTFAKSKRSAKGKGKGKGKDHLLSASSTDLAVQNILLGKGFTGSTKGMDQQRLRAALAQASAAAFGSSSCCSADARGAH